VTGTTYTDPRLAGCDPTLTWVYHHSEQTCTCTSNGPLPADWPSYEDPADWDEVCASCLGEFADPTHGAAVGRCKHVRGPHYLVNCGAPDLAVKK